HGAALHRAAVDHDRAGAALAGVAAHVRAGQPQLLAQHLDEERARFDVHVGAPAVDLQGNRDHVTSMDALRGRAWRATVARREQAPAAPPFTTPQWQPADERGPTPPRASRACLFRAGRDGSMQAELLELVEADLRCGEDVDRRLARRLEVRAQVLLAA